ncbi:MAG: hydantoinase B/oxoprolinase family protein, partial [Pirellulaceae bacterium]
MTDERDQWQFCIDVGGTFTDCVATAPDGTHHHTKLLSSGFIKGSIDTVSGANRVTDVAREEVDGFWNGATIRFLNRVGQVIVDSTVREFTQPGGDFVLTDSLDPGMWQQFVAYELDGRRHAPVMGMHLILQRPLSEALPACNVQLGTTRGTNALLTRTGARTALVTTAGFRDLLAIGDQSRPELFSLSVSRPAPLAETTIEVNERILADGTVERPLDLSDTKVQLQRLQDQGIESLAICLMHAWQNTEHEDLLENAARAAGFSEVRVSSRIAPLIKILHRAETTVLDAYLNPVLRVYLDEIYSNLTPGSRLTFMTSAGGLVDQDRFSGKDCLLSGPAGGVVGAARVGEQIGETHVIGFDMGGTSTDVSRYDGDFEIEYESKKSGIRVVTPVMAIETVAAGGGSICEFDGSRQTVGPASAGNDPGPACYGRGGPLTMTDINLVLGRFSDRQFPFPLRAEASRQRLMEIARQMQQAGIVRTEEEIAAGFLTIANHNMAAAIRTVSVAKGYDPANYTLVSFGGAAGQHCCAVADLLEIRRVVVHPLASMLSAVGIQLADHTSEQVSAVGVPLTDKAVNGLQSLFAELTEQATESLAREGFRRSQIQCVSRLDLRYVGTEPYETITTPTNADYLAAFRARHQQLYGYVHDKPVEIVAARISATVRGRALDPSPSIGRFQEIAAGVRQTTGWTGDGFAEVPAFETMQLNPGDQLTGPAIVSDATTSVFVDEGWIARMLADRQLLLERVEKPTSPEGSRQVTDDVDPVQLEIFNRHFESIAAQMGAVLQRTSSSVNVKERLDFSCALFTHAGDLVVNAPHIPVHLGAMSETVRATIELNPGIARGDVMVTNDPYAGGSHLPDVTVVTPVYDENADRLLFWVASRSHHAELGGKAPGSMPADATCLEDEGVLIQNFKLIERGKEHFDQFRELLTSGPWPSRSPDENIADIAAQVAANRCGEMELHKLVARYSADTVEKYMRLIQVAARRTIEAALAKIPDGEYRFSDCMDNGRVIRLLITRSGSGVVFDFSGTDPVSDDNLNANRAIVSAAIMYVLRCIAQTDIPLNQGIM